MRSTTTLVACPAASRRTPPVQLPEITTGHDGTAVARDEGMRPAPTTRDGIETLTRELDEIEWFGRSTMTATPARVGPLDRLLFLMGATLSGAGAEDRLCPAR
jgi:hypothetical protein